jgi:hypothetical protein
VVLARDAQKGIPEDATGGAQGVADRVVLRVPSGDRRSAEMKAHGSSSIVSVMTAYPLLQLSTLAICIVCCAQEMEGPGETGEEEPRRQ